MRPGAAPPASRSPARGPPQGSCCLRHGNSIHSRPFSPLPCPGALELRGPGRWDESWRPPASLGSRRSSLKKSACQLPPALSAAATCRQGAPEATPPAAAIPRTINFRVPPTLPSTSRAVDELEAILCAGRVTHFRNGHLGTGREVSGSGPGPRGRRLPGARVQYSLPRTVLGPLLNRCKPAVRRGATLSLRLHL